MATKLTSPIHRETAKCIGSRPIILSIAPCGSQSESRIGLRLKGKRTSYMVSLSDLYRVAALWNGLKEKKARREARQSGVSWRAARKKFLADNAI